MRRLITSVSLALLVLLVAAPLASAATTAQIIRDANDGVLDGKYTQAELRAADAAIPAQQREYNDWDAILAAYKAKQLAPKLPKGVAPVVVPPTDSNNNGKVDPAERAKAELESVTKTNQKAEAKQAEVDTTADDTPVVATPDTGKKTSDKKHSDDGASIWPVVLIVLVILALVGVTVWRVIVNRRKHGGDPRA